MDRSTVVAPLFALLAACTSTLSPSPSPSDDGDDGSAPHADAGPTEAASRAELPFEPSNITLDGIDVSKLGDFVATSSSCVFDTKSKGVSCGDDDKLGFVVVEQPDGGRIGVYVARSFRVEPNAVVKPSGAYALAIVALDTLDVQGGIDVGAEQDDTNSGGFLPPTKTDGPGSGPGAGGAGSSTNAGGGAGYCGSGGKGAAMTSGTPAAGGTTYGNPEIVPLVGGSSGGNGTLGCAGAGGGAVQLVAGKTFTLGVNGYVSAAGGGGCFAGEATTQHASGGGSGGSILIEAPTVTLHGTLAANGGAGGSESYGQNGQIGSTAATSPAQTHGSKGGVGSSMDSVAGGDAERFDGDSAGGGGGGAGRIRVNSTSGKSALSSKVLSPSTNGACATEGTLTK